MSSGAAVTAVRAPEEKREAEDSRMQLMLKKLQKCNASETVEGVRKELLQWQTLSSGEREALLDKANGIVEENEKINQTVRFIEVVAATHPSGTGWFWAGLIGFVVLLIVGFSNVEFLSSGLWGTLYVVLCLAGCFAAIVYLGRGQVRRWCRSTLMPRMQQSRIEPMLLLQIMHAFSQNKGSSENPVIRMCRDLNNVYQVFVEDGMVKLESGSTKTTVAA
jgi:hypothetical protein